MPVYTGYGIEDVEEDGVLTLRTGSITVLRQGKAFKFLNAETAENTFDVEKGDRISRGTDADYDISAHSTSK
jgi:hypothetical protein